MEKQRDIWFEVMRFLGDGSVASIGRTCRTLSLVARRELKLRAGQYLGSKNPWVHGFYPVKGYYWQPADDSSSGVEWKRCNCDHHKRLFLGEYCLCESKLDILRSGRRLTVYRCCLSREKA